MSRHHRQGNRGGKRRQISDNAQQYLTTEDITKDTQRQGGRTGKLSDKLQQANSGVQGVFKRITQVTFGVAKETAALDGPGLGNNDRDNCQGQGGVQVGSYTTE